MKIELAFDWNTNGLVGHTQRSAVLTFEYPAPSA